MKKILAFIVLVMTSTMYLFAQNQPERRITEVDGQTIYLESVGMKLYDSGGPINPYGNKEDYVVTFCDTVCAHPNRLTVNVEGFDIHKSDTLYIYDGPSTASPLLYKGNNSNTALYTYIYATTSCLTIRFKSDTAQTADGFYFNIVCSKPCQKIELSWDSIFYRVVNGVEISKEVTYAYEIDTIGTFPLVLDTNYFYAFDFCYGDRIKIPVKTKFPQNDMYYHQSVDLTYYKWTFGDEDTLYRWGANSATHYYKIVQGFDLSLSVMDSNGCESKQSTSARIRIAKNPIKTIFDLPTICNNSYSIIRVGAGNDATIVTEPIEFVKAAAKENNSRVFVPDGPYCDVRCYYAPVSFAEFPTGRKIQSVNDICSICINMEHEYMGDLSIAIVCPEGNKATLKYKETVQPGGGGGSNFFGLPYGGDGHHAYDGEGASGYCDSTYNIPGVGWNYCWSNNASYGYWYRKPGATLYRTNDTTLNAAMYVINNTIPVSYDFGTVLPGNYTPPAGTTAGPGVRNFSTTDSSSRAERKGYYRPSQDFSGLVGCSLNGVWQVEVCDTWGQDNGWVFSWSMELCNINTSDWTYNVGIDTVLWSPRTQGAVIKPESSSVAKVTTPNTSGYFLLNVSIVDSFNCIWDTCTGITTVWTPLPNLGKDTVVCDNESFLLNAEDGHSIKNNYSYMWEPTNETTPSIMTLDKGGITTRYEVEVTNLMEGIRCIGRSDKTILVNPKPILNFDIVGLPFVEGCEPLTIKIRNRTIGGDFYKWNFGDGMTSTEKEPEHTYYAGSYDFKYYAKTDKGCLDSISYADFVSVYTSPEAKFSWDPVTPTVLHPDVQLINLTMPDEGENLYYWKIQYDKANAASVTTLTEKNPVYTFKSFNDGSIAGEYAIKLIALTHNMAPSGRYIDCRDTIETSIVLVNDFLQFPNVITPNGDGINDIFEIKNLVDGLGYPENELSIFNRMGKRVYHKQNISSVKDFWDPGADNSPAGTYFYRFVAKGYLGNIQRNGVIEVLR